MRRNRKGDSVHCLLPPTWTTHSHDFDLTLCWCVFCTPRHTPQQGLSNKFIYFNDDVFLGAPVFPEDFFSPARHTQKLHMAWDVPKCAPGCSDSWIGDGYCECAVLAIHFLR